MSIIEKLKKLIIKWENIADKAYDDYYADAMWNCINDLQELLNSSYGEGR